MNKPTKRVFRLGTPKSQPQKPTLTHEEEIAQLKAGYDAKIAKLESEISSLHAQIARHDLDRPSRRRGIIV